MARQTKDYSHLIGKKFGHRTILDIVQKKQYGPWAQAYAICKCKCGRIDEVKLDNLKSGQSLGCYVCVTAYITSQRVSEIFRTTNLKIDLSFRWKETVKESESVHVLLTKQF